MKKLALLLCLFFCVAEIFSQATPFPTNTTSGNTQTLATDKGARRVMKGFVNGIYADTSIANNDSSHISYYPGAQIFTTDVQVIWLRNSTATGWNQINGNIYFRDNFFLVTNDTVDLINVLDTLRRVGSDVQGRINGAWTYQFTLPDSTPTVNGVWLTTGNTGINDAINFWGTLNDADPVIRRNNIEAGRLGVDQRVSLGEGASAANDQAVAIGFNSSAQGVYSAAFGPGAIANTDSTVAIGDSLSKVAVGKSYAEHTFDMAGTAKFDISGSGILGAVLVNAGNGLAQWQPGFNGGSLNYLVSVDSVSIDDTTLTIWQPTVYVQNGILQTETNNQIFEIPTADSGNYRNDAIVIDETGTFIRVPGTQDSVNTNYPALPANSILVLYVTAFGDQVTAGSPNTGVPQSSWLLAGNTIGTGSNRFGSIDDRQVNLIQNNAVVATLDSTEGNFDIFTKLRLRSSDVTKYMQMSATPTSVDFQTMGNIPLNLQPTGGGDIVASAPAQFNNLVSVKNQGLRVINTATNKYLDIIPSTGGTSLNITGSSPILINNQAVAANQFLINTQTVIGDGVSLATTSSATSILDLRSTSKGFLAPRMTAAQRLAIVSPTTGMMLFDTDSASYFQYNGSAWQNLFNSGGGSGITALTGDVTASGTGSVASTLATVNSNVGSFGSATQAGTFTVNGKGLITAASNTTITPAIGSITGLGTGVETWLATPSSSNLRSSLTDETGTGSAVFATSPTLITPILGVASATSLGIGATATSKIHIQTNAIGSTQSDANGILLENTTAATLGNQQYSPAIVLNGRGWTTGTSASQTSELRLMNTPIQNSSAILNRLVVEINNNSAGYSEIFSVGGVTNLSSRTMAINGLTVIGVGGALTQLYGGSNGYSFFNSAGSVSWLSISNLGKMTLQNTITPGGTTGDRTINMPSGTVNMAAGGTTLTVTNSTVTTTSLVFATIRTNDGTAVIKNVVPGSGSFVITLSSAATAETSIGFFVIN